MLGARDEVGERVGLVQQLAVVVPRTPELASSADVRDREDHAAVEEAHPRRREARVDGGLVRAVAVEEQRVAVVVAEVASVDDRDRHPGAVGSGRPEPLGRVPRRVVAGHRLSLDERGDAGGHVVVVRRRGRHQRHVPVAQRGRRILRVRRGPHRVDGLIGRDDVVFGDVAVVVEMQARAGARARRPRSETTRWPSNASTSSSRTSGRCSSTVVQCARVRAFGRSDHQREVLGAVGVGEHEENTACPSALVVLDVVLVTLHARFDDARFGRHVVGVDQPHLGGHLRRRRDHQHAAGAGALHRHEEPVVVLLVDEHIGAAGVPTVCRQTCHGRIASSGRVKNTVRSSFAHARP